MANLRLAMDAAFWDVGLSTPLTLDATAKSVPGEPAPLDGALASRALRPQQLAVLKHGFPLGILYSLSPPAKKELGPLALHALLPGPCAPNWWTCLIGQFRPWKLISAIKAEVMAADELDLTAAKDVAKHFLDKSLYALGFFSQFPLTPDTSFLFNLEGHGERKERRTKAALVHSLPKHEITLEATLPELFLDQNGTYWNVPLSLSLDMASVVSRSGLRYRFGLHKNSGHPEALNSSSTDVPLTLLPGLCAKAAFSYEKSKDFWREKAKEFSPEKGNEEPAHLSSYDSRLKEPHSAISGIIGGHCAAWFGGNGDHQVNSKAAKADDPQAADSFTSTIRKRNPFTADMFGALCYSFQHGKFKNDFNDLTRVDARLDIASATSFIKGATYLVSDIFRSSVEREANPLSSPRLSLILQQQVAGPIVFRVDSRFAFNSPSGGHAPQVEDVMYGVSYSLRLFESGKVLAWYSPKRKEGMVEFRLFEF